MSDGVVGLLAGIRVLDLSGPEGMYGARLLADLGADVVRIEGDSDTDETSSNDIATVDASFVTFANLNKRAVRLDVRDEAELAALQELINASDLVLCNQLPHGVSVGDEVALVHINLWTYWSWGRTRWFGFDWTGRRWVVIARWVSRDCAGRRLRQSGIFVWWHHDGSCRGTRPTRRGR